MESNDLFFLNTNTCYLSERERSLESLLFFPVYGSFLGTHCLQCQDSREDTSHDLHCLPPIPSIPASNRMFSPEEQTFNVSLDCI